LLILNILFWLYRGWSWFGLRFGSRWKLKRTSDTKRAWSREILFLCTRWLTDPTESFQRAWWAVL